MAQPYKINGSTNGFENKDIASLKVKFYNCEKRIGQFDSGVEKLAAQNVASQGPVHDCTCEGFQPSKVLVKGKKLSGISVDFLYMYLIAKYLYTSYYFPAVRHKYKYKYQYNGEGPGHICL